MLVAGLLAFAAVYAFPPRPSVIVNLHAPSGSTGTIVRMKYVKSLTNGPDFLCKSHP
jgi:hypothetical protein